MIPPPMLWLLQYWIGGAANTAKITACFAQLTIQGKWQVRERESAAVRGGRGAGGPPGEELHKTNGLFVDCSWFKRGSVL